jgi:integrase
MAFRTQRDVDRLKLPPGKKEHFEFDARCPGNSVRIQRGGKPAYVAWYTVAGVRKRFTLGATAGIDLDSARRRATEIVNAARDGRDPGRERKLARIAAVGALTVDSLIETYLREHAERHQRPRTFAETRRALEGHWAPIHALLAGDVSRREVSARLLALARSSGTVAANRARANLSACYVWAIKAGLADHNPVLGSIRGKEETRTRVLSIAELRAIWLATADLGPYGAIVRLLLLTGQRRGEIGGLAWGEIDLGSAMLLLPGARTKNKREHAVPLSRQALAILREFPDLGARCPFVFGQRGRAPFADWSGGKERLDRALALLPGVTVAPWTVHDLRRSFATLAAEHELIEPHVIEATLNHARPGVGATYNRARYVEPMRVGLQRWGDWLMGAVA